MGKILERMVNRRLKQHLETHGLLDTRQHAFRQGYGTSTYFAGLSDILKDSHDKGHHAEIISLDISKAFNRTWTPLVLKQLVDWGIGGHTLHYIRNFLLDRTFRVSVGNTQSAPFPEQTGVPQGTVIAVTLFLVAMNGVFSGLPKDIFVLVYADDILLVVVGPTPVRTRMRTQSAVNAVARWASANGFQLSAAKSVRCHVCPHRHRISGPSITIGTQPIPLRKTVRILGVLVDRFLSFRQHFDAVKAACRTRCNLIKTISKPHRSNNRNIRFRVARAIVDSRLLYGLELTCLAAETLKDTLAPVYNGCIRTISGLLPSTPADSACVEAGLLPFRFFIDVAICNKTASFLAKTTGQDRVFLLREGDRALLSVANMELRGGGRNPLAWR